MQYRLSPDRYDEAFRPDGTPRPKYEAVLEALHDDPRAVSQVVQRRLADDGVEFGLDDHQTQYPFDPVPRLFTADEWSRLEAGLIQRMAALQHFVADAYGCRELIEDGILPSRVLQESRYFEPILAEIEDVPRAWLAGPDIIRDRYGDLRVLEDNTRSPSGLAYAVAGRRAVRAANGQTQSVRGLDGALEALHDTLRQADPGESGDPSIAILSDGRRSTAWYEHRAIADRLDLPLISPDQLEARSGGLFTRFDGDLVAIDVLYNRSSRESLRDDDGRLTEFGELLAEPLRLRTLNCVNAFGMGVADDKAVFCYTEGLIRYYLGEEPILSSVPTFDLGDTTTFGEQADRLGELVVKPRWSFGGHGIVLGPDASAAERRDVEAAVRRAPWQFVAQEPVDFSVHPTVVGDGLEPRHVDLRPFVLAGANGFTVIPGGLTRFAGESGSRIVNSTQGGGAKDTWVLGRP